MSQSCTCTGFARYNIGWDGGLKSLSTFVGSPVFGKDYYGNHRALVLQVVTPATITSSETVFQIKILTCRSSNAGSGTDTWNYAIMDTSYNFGNDGSGGSSPIPSLPPASGVYQQGSFSVYSPSQNSGYLYQTLKLDPFLKIKANTTYQLWFWSDTPYAYHSNYYMGFIANKASYGGTIAVTLEEGASAEPDKPKETFAWTMPKTDSYWLVSAAEWNGFCEKVQQYTGYTLKNGYKEGQFFTAEMFNEAAAVLGIKTRVFIRDHFKGSYFNSLSDALNKLMQ